MKYSLIKGTYLIEGRAHIGYGIGYTENSALSFEDLTLNPIPVAELDLSPIHLKEVVEDFLIEST